MNKTELLDHIESSSIFKEWHWLSYHFKKYACGVDQSLASSILDACLDCDKQIPGFAPEFIDSIAAICGKEKDIKQYEQLLQRLAELLIIRQSVNYNWPGKPQFKYEPVIGGSAKNPEITITCGTDTIGIEVKAPSLIAHINNRSNNDTQIPSRSTALSQMVETQKSHLTLPRDYPVRDFLVSADSKFIEFKKIIPNFYGLLVIVWDDFIYEPISSLLAPQSGLFTPNSWVRDEHDLPMRFPNVDAVIIVRHLHQLMRSSREEPLNDGLQSPLDYGMDGQFPPKACIINPNGSGTIPEHVFRCFQAYTPSHEMGAEYVPQDIIFWI